LDPQYGFTIGLPTPDVKLSTAELETEIRAFMAEINPETGHLD
jgi:hypothetical protein